MIIDQLPTISLPILDTDEIPIERGALTYKVDVGDSFVKKTGDTLTGEIHVKNTAYALEDVPSQPSYERITFTDKNGNAVAFVGSVIGQQSNGIQIGGASRVNGSYVQNMFGMYLDKSTGNLSIAFSDPSVWKSALGISALETILATISSGSKLFLRGRIQYTNITFGSTGYASIDTIPSIATALGVSKINSYNLVSMMIQGFNDGNVYGIARGSAMENIYAIGKPNATTTFGVQYFFVNSSLEIHP